MYVVELVVSKTFISKLYFMKAMIYNSKSAVKHFMCQSHSYEYICITVVRTSKIS